MKKTRIACLITAMGFIVAGTVTPLLAKGKAKDTDDPAVVSMLTSGVWHIEGVNLKGKKWSNDFTFYPDHTVMEGKKKKLTWAISDNKVLIKYPTYNNVMLLPLDPKGTKGLSSDGSPNIATRMEAKVPADNPQAPQPAVATAGVAGKNAIDTIADTGPATTGSVLVPLDASQPPGVRAGITALREKLLDEAAKSPASTPDTYKAAVALCDSWLAALDERDKIIASQSNAQPMGTADMDSSKAVHPGYYALQQEGIDAKKKKQADAKQNAFFSDAQKQQWAQRCTVWQKQLDQLYAQMGDLRRKSAAN